MSDTINLSESYFPYELSPRDKREVKALVVEHEIDTLVGTGLSGAIHVPMLAKHCKVKYAIVRKDRDSTHAARRVVGRVGRRWAFVDDLISSGKTFGRVYYQMSQVKSGVFYDDHDIRFESWDMTYVGAILYGNDHGHFFRSPEYGAQCFVIDRIERGEKIR